MARTKISEFSATPANNTDIDSINIAEGCAPSGINDAIRELMAQLKDWQSGTSNDPYVIGSSGSLTMNQGTANGVAYLNGSKVLTTGSALTFDGTNLGLATSSVGSLGSSIPTFELKGAITTRTGGVRLRSSDNSMDGAFYGAAGLFYFGTSTNTDLAFTYGGSEQMRLTSTGLGIGTSSITAIYGSKTVQLQSSGGATNYVTTGTYNAFVAATTDGKAHFGTSTGSTSLVFELATGVAATLDSSGNLGLGVTPSAWDGGFKVIQLGGGAYFGQYNSGAAHMGINTYFNGTNYIYTTTGVSTRYVQNAGAHSWFNAPSGTAGNAISFTQAMSLTATGNLQLGGTSDKVTGVTGSGTGFTIQAAGAPTLAIWDNTDTSYYTNFTQINEVSYIWNVANGPMIFGTNNTERARIDSSGNLLVGNTTSDGYRFKTEGSYPFLSKATGGASLTSMSLWNNASSGDNIFAVFSTETGGTTRGSISYNRGAGLVAYNTTSDYRAKNIIGPIQDSGSVIDSVPVYMGKMKGATQERPMFIAHETPEYAHTGEKDAVDADGNPVYQQMDASALIPVMWAEIQSLRARLAAANI